MNEDIRLLILFFVLVLISFSTGFLLGGITEQRNHASLTEREERADNDYLDRLWQNKQSGDKFDREFISTGLKECRSYLITSDGRRWRRIWR